MGMCKKFRLMRLTDNKILERVLNLSILDETRTINKIDRTNVIDIKEIL